MNRFGKRETIYAKTLNEIRHQLRIEQYEDENMLNVISKEMTLDEWYEVWMNTCKKNCRNSTKETYAGHYRRIQKELEHRVLTVKETELFPTQQFIVQEGIRACVRNIQKKLDLYCHVTDDTLFEAMRLMEGVG